MEEREWILILHTEKRSVSQYVLV